MEEIKNLLTGTVLLVIIATFSVWYFVNRPATRNILIGTDSVKSRQPVSAQKEAVAEVEVLEGEGLWQVAERVCGDGEAYNYLAFVNGLSVLSDLSAGQELKVSCGEAAGR
ncbi:hypothetical protein HYW61_00515 [candidate division WWE3 bacterium]|nr:hypothetical protein [candidate division WWE3 bacterium]